jgi:acyl-coenzyme A thioesterase PaaI-like protein
VSDLRPVEVDVGRVVFEAQPSKGFYNPLGLVHGCWIALVIDTVMGCAVHSTLEAGQTSPPSR